MKTDNKTVNIEYTYGVKCINRTLSVDTSKEGLGMMYLLRLLVK